MALGASGEDEAVRYLQLAGYALMDRNVRLGKDEMDIIAYDPRDDVIVFMEVKTRRRHRADYPPSLNLTSAKKRRMLRAARAWIHRNGWSGGYRMDVIYIADGQVVQHIRELRIPDASTGV